MGQREHVVEQIAANLSGRRLGHPHRVGVDGLVGAGKSVFARELVAALRAHGRQAVHLDSDGFHHPRAIRYRQGRDSARGYYEDAYDLEALADRVLRPLGTPGSSTYAMRVHDMSTDETISGATATADCDAIIVFDGTFLQRGQLRELWDDVIWLEVDRATALARGAARDAVSLGGEAAAFAAFASRYMAACDLSTIEERPAERASIVIEHTDPMAPRVIRLPGEPASD
nr:uridine kinase [Microcella alkalica]